MSIRVFIISFQNVKCGFIKRQNVNREFGERERKRVVLYWYSCEKRFVMILIPPSCSRFAPPTLSVHVLVICPFLILLVFYSFV